jgi:hypothetical protein
MIACALCDEVAAQGYAVHDDFAVVEGFLVRKFPIYSSDGSSPTGKTRQLQYTLAQGEAGWLLKLDRLLNGVMT